MSRPARHSRRKHKFKTLFMEKKGCACCGFNDIRALQLDHVDPADVPVNKAGKRVTGTSIFKGDLKTVFKHLRKTQILCANCHAIKTFENNETGGAGIKHVRNS